MFWFGVIERLCEYSPPYVHEVLPKLYRKLKPVVLRNEFKIVANICEQARLTLEFYLHRLDVLARRCPMTYLSEY